jgi:glyoxylase-like metal-dependent hydrolase (beta-lactamase superfamily II)
MRHERFTIDADITPRFTACYLRIAGDECAFIEANTAHAVPRLLSALAAHGRVPAEVRWVVVTHAHLDHAAGASALLAACPNATLLAHPRAAKNLIDPAKLVAGATAVYGAARFAELYGKLDPIPSEHVRVLEDGEEFPLGDAQLRALHTYGHAFHHLVVDDPATDTVFTGDAFGVVYPSLQTHGRFALPSTSPTGFHGVEAQLSLDRILGLGRRWVCPTHFDAYEDAAPIGAQVRRFVDRAASWVEQASRGSETLQQIQERLMRSWREAILEEAPRFGEVELRFLALDIELNAQGLAFAADALRAERRACQSANRVA